ncbi:OmpP1/FadL family transporter [Polaribacter glomeratus]|uniref:Hemin receptor n=1 Tax=Polaribacter glomeratus TaxID=102 RepID=A0A2S7WZM0_9FLAO|nr:hemin receptor [Polaribacter glomeratus]PQJ82861.1 hemin receptor [Polaribacter glomeratus]TXD64097.1 hemin receptor [Polaribacter glomeratus]
MKRFYLSAVFIASTLVSFSQSLGYQDLGLLFSQNDQNGTARFTSMSGAFGALGGDLSSLNINPAGLSVFTNSLLTGTINSRASTITSNYYGNSIDSQDQFINLSQVGAVLVFDSAYSKDWGKFAIGFNYRITKNFADSFVTEGNSGIATFIEFPKDPDLQNPIQYNIADSQRFENNYGGNLSEFNLGFSSVFQKNLHVGLSLNFYDLTFNQRSSLYEFNSDTDGNELDAKLYQENLTTGAGFSANLGFIYKVHKSVRLGLSYQTPTYFSEILERTNIVDNDGFNGDTRISVSNDNAVYNNTDGNFFPSQEFIYRLKTPSKLTASTAFIFGKNGLLSLDYSNKSFNRTKLSNSNFTDENEFFQNELRNTHNLNIGSEWRFDRFSVRGGYMFEQNPDKLAINSDNITGYSFGGGYNFNNFKLDFSYRDNNRTGVYNFYSGFDVNSTELSINNKIFTTTLTINL